VTGETKSDVSGWTIDTLRVYLLGVISDADRRYEERFKAQALAVDAAIRAATEATGKAERATELRFESVNEFRSALTDQTATFMTRAAFDEFQKATGTYRDGLNSRFDVVNSRLNSMGGEATGKKDASDNSRANMALIVSVVGIVIMLASLYLRHGA